MSLADLLNQATPGPWTVKPGVKGAVRENHEQHAALIALAPDMARLLIDMAAELKALNESPGEINYMPRVPPLLARFAALNAKAGGAQ